MRSVLRYRTKKTNAYAQGKSSSTSEKAVSQELVLKDGEVLQREWDVISRVTATSGKSQEL